MMICDHTLHGCRSPRFKDKDSYSYIKFLGLLPINFVSSSNSPKYLLLMQQLTRILEFLFIYLFFFLGGEQESQAYVSHFPRNFRTHTYLHGGNLAWLDMYLV